MSTKRLKQPALTPKSEAQRRILAIAPEWKQRNLTARAAELVMAGEANWTPEEAAEAAVIRQAWDGIKAIRLASDTLETEVADGTWSGAPADWPGWPA